MRIFYGVASCPVGLSLIPKDAHRDVYLVLEDFGAFGRVWRETDDAGTNRAWLVRNLLNDLYENPVRIVDFNIAEGWSRDMTAYNAPASLLKFLQAANRH